MWSQCRKSLSSCTLVVVHFKCQAKAEMCLCWQTEQTTWHLLLFILLRHIQSLECAPPPSLFHTLDAFLFFWWTSKSLPSDLTPHIAAPFFWPDLSMGLIFSFTSGPREWLLPAFPWLYISHRVIHQSSVTPIFMDLLSRGIELGPLAFAPPWGPGRGVTTVPWCPKLGSGERGDLWPLCYTI